MDQTVSAGTSTTVYPGLPSLSTRGVCSWLARIRPAPSPEQGPSPSRPSTNRTETPPLPCGQPAEIAPEVYGPSQHLRPCRLFPPELGRHLLRQLSTAALEGMVKVNVPAPTLTVNGGATFHEELAHHHLGFSVKPFSSPAPTNLPASATTLSIEVCNKPGGHAR